CRARKFTIAIIAVVSEPPFRAMRFSRDRMRSAVDMPGIATRPNRLGLGEGASPCLENSRTGISGARRYDRTGSTTAPCHGFPYYVIFIVCRLRQRPP